MAHPVPGSARRTSVRLSLVVAVALGAALATGAARAATNREARTSLDQKAFFRPELYVSSSHVALEDVLVHLPTRAAWDEFLTARGETARSTPLAVFIDPRSGAVSGLTGAFPIIPGDGVGNRLVAPNGAAPDEAAVTRAVRQWVDAHKAVLGIDVAQLGNARTTPVRPDLWQVSIPQEVNGVPVRDARLAATISHGNLVTIGTEMWGNVRRLDRARDEAPGSRPRRRLRLRGGPHAGRRRCCASPRSRSCPSRRPSTSSARGSRGPVGSRLRPPPRLDLRVPAASRGRALGSDGGRPQRRGRLASRTRTTTQQRQVTGGVYPLTSTGICPNAAPVRHDAERLADALRGHRPRRPQQLHEQRRRLQLHRRERDHHPHRAVRGHRGHLRRGQRELRPPATSTSAASNNQHDCTSGRRLRRQHPRLALRVLRGEQASRSSPAAGCPRTPGCRAGSPPTSTSTRPATPSGTATSINFFRSGGGCRNTGEIAGVFDHEWGHGLDDNDAAGTLSNSSEGYADIAAIYRLQTSCVGHGFFQTLNDGCGHDRRRHRLQLQRGPAGRGPLRPRLLGRARRRLPEAQPQHAGHRARLRLHVPCLTSASRAPAAGRCTARPRPSRQAAWDLAARDLQAAPFSLDSQSAFIVGEPALLPGQRQHRGLARLHLRGHLERLRRHQRLHAVARRGRRQREPQRRHAPHDRDLQRLQPPRHRLRHADAARNSGCANGPTTAPDARAPPPATSQVALSWNSVAGATRYWVFRSEGHAGCNFGKTLDRARSPGTSYTDTQVANGRAYSTTSWRRAPPPPATDAPATA